MDNQSKTRRRPGVTLGEARNIVMEYIGRNNIQGSISLRAWHFSGPASSCAAVTVWGMEGTHDQASDIKAYARGLGFYVEVSGL